MKRVLLLLGIGCLALASVSCGSKVEEETVKPQQSATGPKVAGEDTAVQGGAAQTQPPPSQNTGSEAASGPL